jgi:hypothetical protein
MWMMPFSPKIIGSPIAKRAMRSTDRVQYETLRRARFRCHHVCHDRQAEDEQAFGAASTDCGLRYARLSLRPSPPRIWAHKFTSVSIRRGAPLCWHSSS